jgi:hypothetical protein
MNPRKKLARAESPPEPELKSDLAADGGAQGPMCQQHTDSAGINELHPQQLLRLVGFRDPDAGKHHEADESVDASDTGVPPAAA